MRIEFSTVVPDVIKEKCKANNLKISKWTLVLPDLQAAVASNWISRCMSRLDKICISQESSNSTETYTIVESISNIQYSICKDYDDEFNRNLNNRISYNSYLKSIKYNVNVLYISL